MGGRANCQCMRSMRIPRPRTSGAQLFTYSLQLKSLLCCMRYEAGAIWAVWVDCTKKPTVTNQGHCNSFLKITEILLHPNNCASACMLLKSLVYIAVAGLGLLWVDCLKGWFVNEWLNGWLTDWMNDWMTEWITIFSCSETIYTTCIHYKISFYCMVFAMSVLSSEISRNENGNKNYLCDRNGK